MTGQGQRIHFTHGGPKERSKQTELPVRHSDGNKPADLVVRNPVPPPPLPEYNLGTQSSNFT